jgi:glycosyltransferase involved in cell wall biosynthesis
MACGTPVVAFNVGGINDSMLGFPDQLVPANDPVALAKAVEQFVNWRTEDPELGPRSRDWAVQHMSIESSMNIADDLITRIWQDRH